MLNHMSIHIKKLLWNVCGVVFSHEHSVGLLWNVLYDNSIDFNSPIPFDISVRLIDQA
jgi:hypothetical protein